MVREPQTSHQVTEESFMATLTIRNLDAHTKAQLRIQAARHGRSMEEEARTILRAAIEAQAPLPGAKGLGSRIHGHFAQLGGVELDLPESSSLPAPAQFKRESALDTQEPQVQQRQRLR
jgi:plasmid stability protein